MKSVDVRDSSAMRTKSLRMPSAVRSSMMRSPVRPPARPVAMTGWPRFLSARATLMPLPPGWIRPGWQRWRRPICRFATRSVLSRAALRVTVRNTESSGSPARSLHPAAAAPWDAGRPDGEQARPSGKALPGVAGEPAGPVEEAGSRQVVVADEGDGGDAPAVLEDGQLAEPLAAAQRRGRADRQAHALL